jgi:hypothetical protein
MDTGVEGGNDGFVEITSSQAVDNEYTGGRKLH